MAMQTRIAEHQPILELNTTPLIDVMLVLLIMFIITIPIQSHAVKVDLPTACTDCPKPNSFKNEIEVTRAGAFLWNEQPISREGLKYEFNVTQRMQPTPELHLRPDPASRYAVCDDVLAMIKREQVKKFGFVGNEQYASR